MYHESFQGSHYEIGFRFGAALAEQGQSLLSHVPFPVTQERRDFARACVPAYREFFPEILEEIHGLAKGQHCDADALQAVLFSMYAIPPACACSCFAVSDGEHVLLGRNSDFIPALEELNTNAIYILSGPSHSFTGNTTAFVEMEDGVNECGLAVGLTSVYPVAKRPGFTAGLLLRFFLEKCRRTAEVMDCARRIPIASAQTFTVADAQGEIAVIECNSEKTAVIRPCGEQPFVCATNVFHAAEMQAQRNREVYTWESERRYATLTDTLRGCGGKMDVAAAKELLAGKHGFLCQYDRTSGTDTVWSVIYDLKGKAIYRAEGNPKRETFMEDNRFSFR